MSTSDGMRAALCWLATYGVHSTLFLGSAWALCRLRPPRSDRNRERVWKLALVGGVLSATLQLAVGARPLLGRIDWAERPTQASTQADAPAESPLLASRAKEPVPTPTESLRERSGSVPLRLASSPRSSRPLRESRPISEASAPAPRSSSAAEPKRPAADAAPALGSATLPARRSEAPKSGGETSSPAPTVAAVAPEQASSAPEPVERPVGPELGAGVESRPDLGAWRERWPGAVFLAWSLVGSLGMLGLLASWSALRRRMLGRRMLREGPLVESLARLRSRAGIRSPVRLSVSTRISSPFSTGLLRPEVCVPSAVLTDLTRAQQEVLLAHELAHIARRDPAWFGLGYLIEKVLFFQPLNRVARRQLAELAEVACDDCAVRWTGARIALASCLAEVAGWVLSEPRARFVPPGLSGQGSRLRQRVERLLDDRRSPMGDPPNPWWPPLAVGALALVTVAMPGVAAAGPLPLAVDEVTSSPPSPGLAAAAAGLLPPSEVLPSPLPEAPAPEFFSTPRPGPWLDLRREREVVQAELALLEAELRELNAELDARALRGRFADALQRVAERVELLRAQQRRMSELLARLDPPATNTPAPLAPPAQAPDSNRAYPNARPGDSR